MSKKSTNDATQANLSFVYVPFPNLKEATKASKALLSAKLVACANITPGVLSLFMWEGELKEQPEAIVIFKTTPEKVKAVKDTLTHMHPYDTPAIVEIAAKDVNSPFQAWVESCVS